ERVAELLHVGRRTVYDWVDRFHDRSAFDLRERLADAPRPGRPRVGGGVIDLWIAQVIDTDPRDLGYRSTVWTAPLLVRFLHDHQRPDKRLECRGFLKMLQTVSWKWFTSTCFAQV
ncbi:MAG TPA: hypothetical protein VKP69_14305, partial [Isosphaeraceae bacterium]|nr:hypothetical protein [Isosphaeraceae bacterium]